MADWLKGLVFIILLSEILQAIFQNSDSTDKIEEYTKLGLAMYILLFISSFFYE
ncbi:MULTISPECIES: hypothetical protein [Paenisporosarcina]|jgi:hypothetical protein|uniref:Uncharacterized protein n=1 Tax=Paenisporosarcina quisquiliarum TaxID=365346 RepID=A0A9X3LH87_9BACL|nr:hypothetical protein [Paenisporosarcina quisquiliarum]MCZ8537952.1 hypothetical protein [Paenisporosarcina quisquiliarum]